MKTYFKRILGLWVLMACSCVWAGLADDYFAAIVRDDAGAVGKLLRRGMDPNARNSKGQSGLFLAVRESSLGAFEVLLKAPNIKAESRTPQDESPLMMAAMHGQLALAQALIAKNADVNKTGWTPLHYAASSSKENNHAMVQLLLDNDAYIDAASPNGSTPLMMAALYGSGASLKLLLEAGADPLLKNQLGLGAIEFAQRGDRQEMIALLAAAIRAKQPQGTW